MTPSVPLKGGFAFKSDTNADVQLHSMLHLNATYLTLDFLPANLAISSLHS